MYEKIKELVGDKSLPLHGENENGESIVIEAGRNEVGEFYEVTTVQNNNWLRINTYYKDGTVEERYDK